jgi:serine/threonine-protein kinase RsbT
MKAIRSEHHALRNESDVVRARQRVRTLAAELRFSLVDQTKLVTAASEIARNTLIYGGGGEVTLEEVSDGIRPGLRVTFADQGPGIADVPRALRDGYTTGSGLGLGLGGARRLVNEFDIDTAPGRGTRITLVKWK